MPRKPRNTLRQAPGDPSGRLENDELEEYAQLIFKYSLLIEEQADAVRHLPEEVYKAHAIVAEEHKEQQTRRHTPKFPSIEELENILKYYQDLCEKVPQTLLELS